MRLDKDTPRGQQHVFCILKHSTCCVLCEIRAAENYPILDVQYSVLKRRLYNIAGSNALSMTLNIVYVFLSKSFVNIYQLHAS